LHPRIAFQQANVEQLPFADGSFDAVVGNFVILHLACPEQAVVEFTRVLAPDGRLALTTWDAPARCPLLGVFVEAVQLASAVPPPDVPPGPPQFRFADDGEFVALLESAGLEGVEVHTVRFTHRVAGAHELWEGLLSAAVRITALIRGQSEEMQRRIRAEFERLVRPYVVHGALELPVSVRMAVGRKAMDTAPERFLREVVGFPGGV
jgi:SAM-dependent methyltransferase